MKQTILKPYAEKERKLLPFLQYMKTTMQDINNVKPNKRKLDCINFTNKTVFL